MVPTRMTSLDPAVLTTPPTGNPVMAPPDVTDAGPPRDAVFSAAMELVGTLDVREVESRLLHAATDLLAADTTSLWVSHGGGLACPVAIGSHAAQLVGARLPSDDLDAALPGEEDLAVATASFASAGGALGAVRVARGRDAGAFTPAEHRALGQLASAAGIALANARRVVANDRARDLALVMEMSREIASTLDLDRVMRSVVNLAMKALPFDRGAIALYERGTCDIRAVAGAETVDPDDPELQDLAVRAAWAAGIGQSFYLSDRTEPASDAERLFLQIFSDDLAADGVASGLYIPLKDDEGVVGILVLESARPDFATARQQEMATILANQATVALRNAQLYQQVPLADALGAL